MDSLCFLARRACLLVHDLVRRGHAAMQPVASHKAFTDSLREEPRMITIMEQSRYQPDWASARNVDRRSRRMRDLEILIRINLPDA